MTWVPSRFSISSNVRVTRSLSPSAELVIRRFVTETREFSAVCPYSGLPDFATLTVRYVPKAKCVELKSLKYYVTSYRSVGIFQEHATAKIAEDLFRVLEPQALVVTTVYNVRGGFETTCTVELPESGER